MGGGEKLADLDHRFLVRRGDATEKRFEERYGHIETNVELKKIEKDAEEQYKIIREMSLDTNF